MKDDDWNYDSMEPKCYFYIILVHRNMCSLTCIKQLARSETWNEANLNLFAMAHKLTLFYIKLIRVPSQHKYLRCGMREMFLKLMFRRAKNSDALNACVSYPTGSSNDTQHKDILRKLQLNPQNSSFLK